MTILVTTHNLVEADYCDRIAIMNEGRIITVEAPDNLRKDFVRACGEVYEFYPESPVDTGTFTSRQISITPFGRRFHVWKKNLQEQELRALLDSAGIGYRFIRGIRPPMEDVFIYFLGREP